MAADVNPWPNCRPFELHGARWHLPVEERCDDEHNGSDSYGNRICDEIGKEHHDHSGDDEGIVGCLFSRIYVPHADYAHEDDEEKCGRIHCGLPRGQ